MLNQIGLAKVAKHGKMDLRMGVALITKHLFEIAVMWVIFYQLYRLFHRERAAMILGGLVILSLLALAFIKVIDATELEVIGSALVPIGTILAILFQSEIRTALARIGRGSLRKFLHHGSTKFNFIEEMCDAVSYLTNRRFGAIIVICREDKILGLIDNEPTPLDATFTAELLESIFYVNKQGQGNPLHDGAVIIDNERIMAAKVILPVSQRELTDRSLGLRHRAGLGIAEVSDAVVIIVSEETGGISLAVGGSQAGNAAPELQRDLSLELLKVRLEELLDYHEQPENQHTNEDGASHESEGNSDE